MPKVPGQHKRAQLAANSHILGMLGILGILGIPMLG